MMGAGALASPLLLPPPQAASRAEDKAMAKNEADFMWVLWFEVKRAMNPRGGIHRVLLAVAWLTVTM